MGQVCAQPKTNPLTSGRRLNNPPANNLGSSRISLRWKTVELVDVKLSYNRQIFGESMLQSPDLHWIEAKTTTSSLD